MELLQLFGGAAAAGAATAGGLYVARRALRIQITSFEEERAETADRMSVSLGVSRIDSAFTGAAAPEGGTANTGIFFGRETGDDGHNDVVQPAARDGFAAVLIEYYSYALTQAKRSFITSQLFSALGVLVILGGIGLAIWRANTDGEMFAAIVTSSSGLISTVIGQMIHRRADIALKHMADQTESLRSDMRLERSVEQAVGLLKEVDDPEVTARLVAGLIMKLSGADMPSIRERADFAAPGAASSNGSQPHVKA
ncbi:hypothetical protein ACFW91_38605 [Streptomyces asoensis]|uniref:TRADD-N-associated membrane domain-containing protein n=1 Tax=Streptomyces asoensis TaxID=249586 RepID=UPI0036B5713C